MDENKKQVEEKEVLKLGNEIVALLPSIFDASFDYAGFLIGQLKKFAKEKGFPLEHLDLKYKASYDMNLSAVNHSMKNDSSFIIKECDGKFFATFETTSSLKNT